MSDRNDRQKLFDTSADIKEKKRQLRQAEYEHAMMIREIYGKKQDKPSEKFLEDYHKYVVVEDLDSLEAWERSLEDSGKDAAWYDRIKYDKIYGMSAAIVDKYKHRKGYRRLVSEGGLNTRDLKKSGNTQNHVSYLASAQRICRGFDELRAEGKQTNARIDRIEDRVESNEVIYKMLYKCQVEGISARDLSKDDKIDLTCALYSINRPAEEIAEVLGISKSSVFRYLKMS